LHHQLIGVAVGHEAGQGVALPEHQADGVGPACQARAPGHRLGHARRHPGCVDALFLAEAPATHPDLGFRAIGAPGEKIAAAVDDADGVARLGPANDLRHGRGVNPGMTPQQGFFLAGLEHYIIHDFLGPGARRSTGARAECHEPMPQSDPAPVARFRYPGISANPSV